LLHVPEEATKATANATGQKDSLWQRISVRLSSLILSGRG
jgi:hypothetical protein